MTLLPQITDLISLYPLSNPLLSFLTINCGNKIQNSLALYPEYDTSLFIFIHTSYISLISSCEYFGEIQLHVACKQTYHPSGSHFILWTRIHQDRNNTEVLFWCFSYHKIFKQITLDAECKVPLKFDQFFT